MKKQNIWLGMTRMKTGYILATWDQFSLLSGLKLRGILNNGYSIVLTQTRKSKIPARSSFSECFILPSFSE